MNTDDILRERGAVHGDFADDARISQDLKDTIRESPNWADLTHVQSEALDQICTKIARILSGNPNFADHWADIQGYARLVEIELDREEKKE